MAVCDSTVTDFTICSNDLENDQPIVKKKPKRVLHFCDGTIEEFSSDEEEQVDNAKASVNTHNLEWLPWMWHHTTTAGVKTLEVFDYIGESLASFFGITTPKYQLEINEYYKMMKNEEEEKKKQDLEMGGWTTCENSEVIQNQYATDFSPAKLQCKNSEVKPLQDIPLTIEETSKDTQKESGSTEDERLLTELLPKGSNKLEDVV